MTIRQLAAWVAFGAGLAALPAGAQSVRLHAMVHGQGRIVSTPEALDCGAVCRARLAEGTTLVLTATPAPGQRFVGWTGDCTGALSCTLTVNEKTSLVGARFLPQAEHRFSGRPYLFKADEARLRASLAANDPEAIGSIQNTRGAPIGFLSLARAAHANRGAYRDIPTWHVALAGWLLEDTAMLQQARDEAMAIVAAAPGGDTGRSETYQHAEDRMLNVAAVADLAYSQFSAAQLTQVANFVNGSLTNWNTQNLTYWPGDDALNNYWQNGFLAHVVGGIATQGFNPQAATWRTKTETMARNFINRITVGWSGPVQTEGHYYSGYIGHALWAMELYDAALGTTLVSQSKFSPAAQLDLVMYQTRPHLLNFFEVGSESNDSTAPHTFLSQAYWRHLISTGRGTPQAQQAKAILSYVDANVGWPRWGRAFANFYWNIYDIPEVPLSAKTDRLYAAPTPGAGLIGVRSSAGFQTNARAALMFATHFGNSAAYSHANPDAPGFQWGDGADWLVTDPEFYNRSGVIAEAGETALSDVSNIVTLAGYRQNSKGVQPRILYAQDNRSADVPHFYVQIDAQPYWNMTSLYRRDYVWLDDLRAVVIWDHIVGAPAKKWRLHIPAEPVVDGSTARYVVNGITVTVSDLMLPNGRPWAVERVLGVWRLSHDDPSNDYRSFKLLDAGERIKGSVVTHGAGWHESTLTLEDQKIVVRFYDDGQHAKVTATPGIQGRQQ